MPFTWTESEGELTVEINAPDERAVFAEGFEAMRELLRGQVYEGRVTRQVELAGRDRAALLVDFLAEIAILGDTEGLVPERLTELELDADGVRASIEGGRGRPRSIVTGATYDRLAFEPGADGWSARAVLGTGGS
jgi:SHS2 domain-containing protein